MTEVDSRPSDAAALSRRTFLKRAAAIATVALLDSTVTQEHWPATPTRLVTLPNSSGEPNYNAWLVAPGYGSVRGQLMARQVRRNDSIPDSAPVGAFVYGNEVVKMADLSDKAQRFARQQRLAQNAGSLSLYCHSMGGIIGLNAAKAVGLPVRDIILNGSPFDINDARMSAMAHAAAVTSEATGYRGSIVSKYIGAIYKRFADHGVDGLGDFVENFGVAGRQTWNGASPYCLASQLCILDNNPLEPTGYDEVLVPGFTRATYCMPHDPEGDQTVFDLQASAKYTDFFAAHDIAMSITRLPVPAHANTVDAMEHTGAFLQGRFLNDDSAT